MSDGRCAKCFLSLLIRLPIVEPKGIGFLVDYNVMDREAIFVFNPITKSAGDYTIWKCVAF